MSLRRLFVAIWPPDDVIEMLATMPRKPRPGVRFVEPESWHVSLRFLGSAEAELVAAALDRSRLVNTTIRLGPLVEMLGDHSVILRAAGADGLAHEVASATSDIGHPPRRRFVGHLTLARLSRSARPGRLPLLGAPFTASFEAGSVALVESILRPDGARYTTLATWPCAAGPPGSPETS